MVEHFHLFLGFFFHFLYDMKLNIYKIIFVEIKYINYKSNMQILYLVLMEDAISPIILVK